MNVPFSNSIKKYHMFIEGMKDCIPTLIGYISIGFAFGVVGVASSLSLIEIFLLSCLVYAGSAQFIFCSLIVVGAPFSVIIMTIFIVNLRHLLMSFSIAPYFTNYSFKRNIGFGTLLTDETFGVAIVKANREGKLVGNWMDGLNITAYLSWIIACTIGGIVGHFLPNPQQYGLDYALVAMFIALLILTLIGLPKTKIMHYVKLIVIVVLCMYGFLYIMPSHVAVLLTTVVVASIGVMTE